MLKDVVDAGGDSLTELVFALQPITLTLRPCWHLVQTWDHVRSWPLVTNGLEVLNCCLHNNFPDTKIFIQTFKQFCDKQFDETISLHIWSLDSFFQQEENDM